MFSVCAVQLIAKFRDDEEHHGKLGAESGAARAPAYPLLSAAIRNGCRVAIFIAERI